MVRLYDVSGGDVRFHFALLLCVCAVAGCEPPQPLNFSVQNVQAAGVRVDVDLKETTVTPAAPNERTGSLPPAVADITDKWKEATEEALARTAIFNDDSRKHVNLEIKVLKLDMPAVGITFPTNTEARYSLIDRSSGNVLFSQVIASEGDTPFGFAFIGAIRARESVDRSVQHNIAGFIDALEHSRLASARGEQPAS